MAFERRISAIFNKVGDQAVYRRVIAGGIDPTTLKQTNAYTDYPIKVRIDTYSPYAIAAGLATASNRKVKFAAIDLPFSPKKHDKIIAKTIADSGLRTYDQEYEIVDFDGQGDRDKTGLYTVKVQ